MDIPKGTYGFRFAEDKEPSYADYLRRAVILSPRLLIVGTDWSGPMDLSCCSNTPFPAKAYMSRGTGLTASPPGKLFSPKFQDPIAIIIPRNLKSLGIFYSCYSGPI